MAAVERVAAGCRTVAHLPTVRQRTGRCIAWARFTSWYGHGHDFAPVPDDSGAGRDSCKNLLHFGWRGAAIETRSSRLHEDGTGNARVSWRRVANESSVKAFDTHDAFGSSKP